MKDLPEKPRVLPPIELMMVMMMKMMIIISKPLGSVQFILFAFINYNYTNYARLFSVFHIIVRGLGEGF